MIGLDGAGRSKQHIKDYKMKQFKKDNEFLEKIIMNETNACRACNLSSLMQPKWSEMRNAY